jgi:hypothetical protein
LALEAKSADNVGLAWEDDLGEVGTLVFYLEVDGFEILDFAAGHNPKLSAKEIAAEMQHTRVSASHQAQFQLLEAFGILSSGRCGEACTSS